MRRLDKKFKAPPGIPLYATGAILTIAAVTAVIFLFTTSPEKLPETEKVELSVEQTDVSLPAAIDTLEALPETEQIRIASLKTSQQEIQNQPVSVPTTDVEEIPAIVLHPLTLTSPKETVKIAKQRTAKEVSYHDLKVVDYSAYRDKPTIAAERIVLSGTPANLESENNESTETTITAVDIPYMDYINKTMRYVSKGKWKESLQRLQLILKTYPDDVNAHFYAGLCSYNLQQYEEAKQHFANCLQLPFSNFNEESSWYLAQSLLADGEKSQAKELLIVIRDQKGYYSRQAEKVLKSW
jgi:TolA-binding protein